MDSDPSEEVVVHSHQSEKPIEHWVDKQYFNIIVAGYLVASLTLSDGHVWHQVPVVCVPQRWRPLADNDLSWSQRLEDGPAGNHRTEGSTILLEGI